MSAHAESLDEAPVPSLKRLWQSGPYGWNQALTRWYVLIPFFAIAATTPFITQYFVDTFGWTGGEYWLPASGRTSTRSSRASSCISTSRSWRPSPWSSSPRSDSR